MLDLYYMKGVEKFLETDNYIVWKFPASSKAYEKQARPLVYSYSIMTRAYGTHFNDDNMIACFNDEGFDVYLVDWGKNGLFTLKGWTLDDLAERMETEVIDPLLKAYNVEKLNVFGVCIGGVVISYMIAKDKARPVDQQRKTGKKLHRVSYYGTPILGARDLGMQKTFVGFHQMMSPWQAWFKDSGLSLFMLDMMILYSGSLSMLNWTWGQYFQENTNNSLKNIVQWTVDDRWVPFTALMDIIETGFDPNKQETDFHFTDPDIHFLNIVGKDDMLVKPSASIIEWNSPIPGQYKSFKQAILNTDHFMFARPGFKEEKADIARWFAGYDAASMMYKLKMEIEGGQFDQRAGEIFENILDSAYRKASRAEKRQLVEKLAAITGDTAAGDNFTKLTESFVTVVRNNIRDPEADGIFFDTAARSLLPIIDKCPHREGNFSKTA